MKVTKTITIQKSELITFLNDKFCPGVEEKDILFLLKTENSGDPREPGFRVFSHVEIRTTEDI